MLNNMFSFLRSQTELKFHVHQPSSIYNIAVNIRTIIQEANLANKKVVVLCIGTDRSTGDALGPLTGSKLQSYSVYPHIYGTLDDPVHAINLSKTIENIQEKITQPFIIAVDACLGKLENVGYVNIGAGPLKPGAAVNKDLPSVGNAYITGIVNVGGFMEHMVLQSTRLNLVMKMADTIAHGIVLGLKSSNSSSAKP